jgi:hypothetical protein
MVAQVHCRAWAVPVMLPHLGMVISQVDAIGEVEVGLAVVLPSHDTWCIARCELWLHKSQWKGDMGSEL